MLNGFRRTHPQRMGRDLRQARRALRALLIALLAGCSDTRVKVVEELPNVGPASQPAPVEALHLEPTPIDPLYRELLTIDLPSALKTAVADNLEIQRARLEVEQS